MSSLSRLEEAGIPVVTSLTSHQTQLTAAAGIIMCEEAQDEVMYYQEQLSQEKLSIVDYNYRLLDIVLGQWYQKSKLPPTWTSLHHILKQLKLDNLCQQIEDFLDCKLIP